MPSSLRSYFGRDLTVATVGVLVAALAISTLYYNISLGGLFYYYTTSISTNWGLLLFIALFCVSFSAGHYLLTKFVRKLLRGVTKSRFLFSTYRIVEIAQYVMAALIVIIILQMIFFSKYYVGLFVAVPTISFSLAAIIMGYLSFKFISWYKSNRNFVVLLCGTSFILLTIGLFAVVVIVGGNVLVERDPIGIVTSLANDQSSPEKSLTESIEESKLWNIVSLPYRPAFIIYWIANVFLLRTYSSKIGRTKFWFLVCLPLVGFVLVSYVVIIASLNAAESPFNMIFYSVIRIVASIVTLVSGILFAIMFLGVGRIMKESGQTHVQNYLKCCAYGTIIFVISLTIHVGSLAYPPTVLIPWAFAGMASFLVSFGFYSLAISASHDIKLRKSIKSFVTSESKLFENIAAAEMQVRLEQQVGNIIKAQEEEFGKDTDIKPSLTNEDLKCYLRDVIAELKDLKK
ncbi:MAG TPA: hypothetical protein VH415_07825 [Nitrososphaeraceae archaeon]|jgi:hypothetical protein